MNAISSRKPATGRYRVIATDTLDKTSWVLGDYVTLGEACEHVSRSTVGAHILRLRVYDQNGNCVMSDGFYT